MWVMYVTIDYLVSGSPILTPKKYKERHGGIGQYINWKIGQYYMAPLAGN